MTNKIKILVVCSRNKKRSLTAEKIYTNDQRILIRSVGTSPKARRKINMTDIQWADVVLCMENKHSEMIQQTLGKNNLPKILLVSNIEDKYEFMDSELVKLLRSEIEDIVLGYQ